MKNYLILILLSIGTSIYAQKTITVLGQIDYIRSTNLLEGSELDGHCRLIIGRNESKFIHLNTPSESKIIEDGFSLNKLSSDKEGFPIYINLEDKYYVEKTTISSKEKLCTLEDNLSSIDWKMLGETKEISSFKCHKASGFFRGRNYIVWFTPDIPFSGGPHKLNGLPGLILDAKSEDGKVAFTFSRAKIKKESQNLDYFSPPSAKLQLKGEKAFVEKEIAIHLALKKEIQSKIPGVQINVECPRGDIRIEKDFYDNCSLPLN